MRLRLLPKLLFCFFLLPFLNGQEAQPILLEYYLEDEVTKEWQLSTQTFYE